MYDKFGVKCKRFGWRNAYAQLAYKDRQHYQRFKSFIESLPRKLVCQECGGGGGWIEPVLDSGSGPFFTCGFCEGLGYTSPWLRGQWLKWKRSIKQAAA